ncbi:transcriptional repressor [Mucilaginibacter conchicola]
MPNDINKLYKTPDNQAELQILAMLKKSEKGLDAEAIYFQLRETGLRISISSVYSKLKKLVGTNMVSKTSSEGRFVYVINS